jgi:hypothetical protein
VVTYEVAARVRREPCDAYERHIPDLLKTGAFAAVNRRGLSEPPAAGAWVSTYRPYWVIAAAPAPTVVCFWNAAFLQAVRRARASDGRPGARLRPWQLGATIAPTRGRETETRRSR